MLEARQRVAQAGQPLVHTGDLAFAERGHAGHAAGGGAGGVALQFHGQQVLDAESLGNRPGDELVGGGDDGDQITGLAVPPQQIKRCGLHLRADHLVDEAAAGRLLVGRRTLAPGLGAEGDVGVDVERAGQVLAVELVVAQAVQVGVDPAQRDHELAEGVVGVAGNQRAVEVE